MATNIMESCYLDEPKSKRFVRYIGGPKKKACLCQYFSLINFDGAMENQMNQQKNLTD